MEHLALAAYAVYFIFIAVGGLMAVFSSNIIRALLGLIIVMSGVAGIYLLLNSPFIAFMQLLIYVGAISVLIFFAIMLAKDVAGKEIIKDKFGRILLGAFAASLPVGILAFVSYNYLKMDHLTAPEISLSALGEGLLGSYSLAFELISVVLLVSMVGAVLLVFERRKV